MLKVTKLSTSAGGAVKTANYYKTHDKKLDTISPNRELFKKEELDSLDEKGYSQYVLEDKDVDTAQYSEWGGKLAEELGLAGKQVDIVDLANALNGKIGDQQIQLGVNKNRKMGDDFTFSASKSMSILAFIEGDKRLINVHKNAVKEAMAEVIKNVPELRVFKGRDNQGNPILENVATDKVMYAMETHKVSREGDPQIHDHVILVNATLDDNGKARAMTINKLYDNSLNTYFGSIYQHSCRKGVEELGYKTYSVGKHGQFNIKGISQDNLDYFSKRRAEILKEQEKFKASNPNTRDKIAKYSRNPKAHLTKDQIAQIWDFGKEQFDNSALVKESYDKLEKKAEFDQNSDSHEHNHAKEASEVNKDNPIKTNNIQDTKITAEQAIQRSISNIGKYSTKLTHVKILGKALSDFAADNKLTHHDLKLALDKLDKSYLVPLDKHGTVFATQEMIAKEKSINDNVQSINSSFQTKLAEAPIDNNIINANKGVALGILESKNQVNLLSIDGSSKDSVEYITKALNSSDKSAHILTSNKENQIHDINTNIEKDTSLLGLFKSLIFGKQKETGVNNQIDTVGGYTYKLNNNQLTSTDVLIVDQADRLSVDDMLSITKQAKYTNTKLIFLNQKDGLTTNRAGNVIDTLKQSNVPQFEWQKQQNIEKKLHIHEDKNHLALTSKMYSLLSKPERENIQIVTTATDKEKLNDAIRYNLQRDSELSDSKTIKATKDIKLSKEHASIAKNYPIGSNITFFKDRTAYSYDITGHDLDNNKVITTDKNGNKAAFDPVEATKQRPRITQQVDFNYALGETVRVDKGSKNGLSIGEYKVSKIENNRTELINTQTGKARIFKDEIIGRANLSHTYAKTIDNVSYENDKNLIATFLPFSLKKELASELTNKTKESLTIITNDATIANKSMQKNGIKDSVITTTIDSSSIKKEQIKDVYTDLTNALDKLNTNYNKDNIAKAVEHAVDSINQKEATFDIKDVFDIGVPFL